MRLKPASSLDRETKPSAAMSSLKPRCSLAKVAEESGSSTFSEMAEAVMRTGTHSSVDRPDARPELLRRTFYNVLRTAHSGGFWKRELPRKPLPRRSVNKDLGRYAQVAGRVAA